MNPRAFYDPTVHRCADDEVARLLEGLDDPDFDPYDDPPADDAVPQPAREAGALD